MLFKKGALLENLFVKYIAPLAPTLPPVGAGAHCDVSELPVQELSLQIAYK
jgi:hypothetical protein